MYSGFVGYPLGKKIWGNRDDYAYVPVSKDTDNTVHSKSKMIVMVVIFIATLVMFVLADKVKEFIPAFNVGTDALISAIMCVLTGCISHKDALKSINWNLAIWFCACLGIAAGLNSSGGGELLANCFIGMFGENVSAFVLYLAFLILVTVLTQFLSNSTVLTMILPIVFSITERMGYNTYSFAVGLTIAGAMAVATPLANTTIGMSMIADYKFSDYLKYAGPMTLISIIVLIMTIPVLFPLV